MVVALAVIGIILALFGLGMIGFGLPSRDFSFGNTMIVAGSVLTGSGFVVFSLAAALRELHRIAWLLSPARNGRPDNVLPFPSREVAAGPAAGPAESEDAGEAVRFPARPPAHPHPAEHEADHAADHAEASQPQALKDAPKPGLFESFWPPRDGAGKPSAMPLESPVAAPSPAPGETGESDGASPPPSQPIVRTFRPARSQPVDKPPEGSAESAEIVPMKPEPATPPAPPAAPTILKSGTVDGMAYALYSDGSIEADLPEGRVRFANLNALRARLESNS